MPRVVKLLLSLVVSFAAGGIGSLATTPNIPTWYAALEKPFFNPPNWVFGPVWTLLYILMGVSLYLVWTSKGKASKQTAHRLFGVQLVLNALWSIVFFGLHQPWLAVAVIAGLLVILVFTVRVFAKYSRLAAWLLVPYVAWVSFAYTLNIGVALLN